MTAPITSLHPTARAAERLKDHRTGLAATPPAAEQQPPLHGQGEAARLERRRGHVDGKRGSAPTLTCQEA